APGRWRDAVARARVSPPPAAGDPSAQVALEAVAGQVRAVAGIPDVSDHACQCARRWLCRPPAQARNTLPRMSDARLRRKVAELRAELERRRYRYYVLSDPEIPDADFDALMEELREIERQHPELDHPDSPTHKVGTPPAGPFTPVRHAQRMLSLDNVFDTDGLREWAERVERNLEGAAPRWTCELKIDG